MTAYVSTINGELLEVFDTLGDCRDSMRKLKRVRNHVEYDTRETAEAAVNEPKFTCNIKSYNMYSVLKETYN